MTIGIVEDDEKIRKGLKELLEKNGYEVFLITNFSCCIADLESINIHLLLLDVNLPYEDGFSLCQKLKKIKNIPVIFVTSRNTNEDELKSIKAGGIDFITKPYNKLILLEKIRRALEVCPIVYRELTKSGYTLDLHMSLLKYKEQEVELTRNEFRILYYFFISEHDIITKEELLEYLWNDKYYLDENILMVGINRLRKKALEIGIKDFIKTVRGKGYQL